MQSRSFMLVLAILILSFSLASAGEVRTITLENGLDVVMMPDASSPLLSSLVIVKTGSSYEDLSTAGATHMLEHMMFRGTETRTQGEIYDGMDLMGAYYNAQTSKTYTNYILVVPKEHAANAMAIQADMILHSTVPADTYLVEKGRVIAEIQQSHNRATYPAEIAHIQHVYGDTPYGFPTLGSVSGITALSRDAVKQFHDDWYTTNNMTLVLKGDLTYSEMENLAREIYGSEPARKLPARPESWPVGFENWRAGRTFYTYGDVNSGTVFVSIPAPSYESPDYPAFQLISNYLDNLLEEKLRGPGMPRITYVYSSTTVDPGFSVLDIQAGLMQGADAQSVVDDIIAAVKELSQLDYSEAELIRTHESMLREELFFSEQVQYGSFLLVPKLAVAPYPYWEIIDSHRGDVTPDEAGTIAMRWFTDPLFVASVYLPRSEESESAGIMMGSVEASILPSNGLAVYARQVKGAPVAGIHIVARNRALLEDSHRGWADLLHRLLLNSYDDISADSLKKLFDDIGMDVSTVDDPRVPFDNYRTTPEYSFIRVEVVAERWRSALEMMGKLFARLDPSEDTITATVTEIEGIIQQGKGKLSSEAGQLFKDKLFGPAPLAAGVYGGDTSALEGASPKSVKTFAKRYFAGNNLIVSVVSPASPEEVFEATAKAFKNLPEADVAVNQVAPVSEPGQYEVTGSGRQGYLASGFLIPKIREEDRAALIVANAMVSDLIYRDLGEKKGWAYGAGSSLYLRPGWGAWTVSMGLPEEHLQESETVVYEHLKRIADGDFDENRFEVARQSVLGKTLRRYSSRINLAMALGVDAFYWNNPLDTWNVYEQTQQLTLEDVRKVARQYLASANSRVTVLGKPEPGEQPSRGMPGGMMRGMGGM